MLNKVKSISLTGESTVTYNGEDVQAVHLYTNIADEGGSNTNITIVNKDAYEANLEDCRADIDEFTAWVREIEDAE